MARTRAERRHHHNRMKKRTEEFRDLDYYRETDPEKFAEQVCRRAENRQRCSCHMCGNPRKHWKEKTLQEKIAELKEQDGD